MEIRLRDVNLEYDKEQRKIGGYINVVERPSEIMFSHKNGMWFQETMKTGVFQRALQKNNAIPLLLEHDYNKQIASTLDGTLELREDAIGLRFDAIVNEDAFNEIENRGIHSCSFGFKINEQSFEPVNSKLEKRYVSNIDLFEVSLVQNPAYIGSLVEKRALEDALEEETRTQEVESEISEEKEIIENKEDDKSSVTEVEDTEERGIESDSTDEIQQEEIQEVVEESIEKEDEERSIEVDMIESTTEEVVDTAESVTEDAKEVIQQVIDETIKDAEFYGEMAEMVEDAKKEVIEESQRQLECLEYDSLYYTQNAYMKWLEVAKLKQIKMSL